MDNNKTGADVTGVTELAAFLERFPKVMVLSGAGMSTASGIPDYRDQNGIRRGIAPVQGPEFRRMEAIRRRYWARSMVGWPTLAKAIPNAGHHAIADLEAAGKISTVLTQNVDGLHQQAGSTNVIELHGNIHTVVCLDCCAQFSRIFIQMLLEQANPDLVGAVGMDLQVGRKNKQRAVLHTDHDLVGIFGRQFRYRWPNNRGLTPQIVKIDSICTRQRLQIIDTAQKVVRMAVDFVRGALRQHGGPASGYLKSVVTDFLKIAGYPVPHD